MKKPITSDTKKALFIFFAILLGLTAVFEGLILTFGFRSKFTTGLMWSVGIAGILTCLIMKRDLKTLGWGWGDSKYQWWSYFIPIAYGLVAYLIIWGADLGGFYNTEFVEGFRSSYSLVGWGDVSVILFYVLLTATVGMAGSMATALGEEIGWRGFLTPELAKFMSFSGVVLVSGLIWAVWHWPIIAGTGYSNEGVSIYYQLFFFTLFVLSATTIMTYIRLKTGSLWTAAIFHASHNLFIQGIYTPLTVQYEDTGKYIDEFGAIPPIVAFLVAIYFWKKGRKEFA